MIIAVIELLNKFPKWFFSGVIAPLLTVATPIAIVHALLWFLMFRPSIVAELNASVDDKNAMVMEKYNSSLSNQNLINTTISEKLERIDKRQDILLNAVLKNRQ